MIVEYFLSGCRIFILTTLFGRKVTKLNKKSKFETTGSNPDTSVSEESTKTKDDADNEKFEELLAALTKIDDLQPSSSEGLVKKFLDTGIYEKGLIENAYPTYILDIEEEIKWLYSVQRKTYVPVKSGSEVIPVVIDQKGYFCLINNELFSLEEEWVTCLGWH